MSDQDLDLNPWQKLYKIRTGIWGVKKLQKYDRNEMEGREDEK